MTGQEIARLLREKDEQAFGELIRQYSPLIKYIIAPIVTDAHEREDCLSETVMRIWSRAEQFDPERGTWKAWLTAVARSTALNRARKNRSLCGQEELSESTPSPDADPEQLLLRRERQRELQNALGRLSESDRHLFFRKYYYRQPTAQIASETGLTERAVEGRLYRLRLRLRTMLGGEHGE